MDKLKLRILKQNKRELSYSEQKKYLEDFFNTLSLIRSISTEESAVSTIYDAMESLLILRLYLLYEDELMLQSREDIANIVLDNDEYVEELKQRIKELEEKNHISYTETLIINKLNEIVSSYNTNIYEGYIYTSDCRESLYRVYNNLKKSIFNRLSKYINLGTKSLSTVDTNYKVAKYSYDIICDKDKKEEIDNYLNKETSKLNSSDELNYLIRKISKDDLIKLSLKSKNRSLLIESYLLCFIVCNNLNNFDRDLLEDYFGEDKVEELRFSAENNTENALDQMCLRRKIEVM